MAGGVLLGRGAERLASILELLAVGAGSIAVGGLILGCIVLLRETRIAVLVVSEESTLLREHFSTRSGSP
jgi:hypothetical protein